MFCYATISERFFLVWFPVYDLDCLLDSESPPPAYFNHICLVYCLPRVFAASPDHKPELWLWFCLVYVVFEACVWTLPVWLAFCINKAAHGSSLLWLRVTLWLSLKSIIAILKVQPGIYMRDEGFRCHSWSFSACKVWPLVLLAAQKQKNNFYSFKMVRKDYLHLPRFIPISQNCYKHWSSLHYTINLLLCVFCAKSLRVGKSGFWFHDRWYKK